MTANRTLIRLCGVLVLGACSHGSPTEPTAPAPPNRCTDPRPQVCTQEYVGVCATLADGSVRTSATGCTACADPDVVGWRLGECD